MRKATLFTVMAVAVCLVTASCDKLKSRDQQNQGVRAYTNAHYAEAVEHFKQAIAFDPENSNARLFLATAYMSQWIPGAESPENLAFAAKAKEEFLKVLEKDPNDKTALASLASIAYNQAGSLPPDKKNEKFDEAIKWHKRVIEVDPKNKEAYYSLGVIAWAKWYPVVQTARVNLKMRPEDPGPLKDKKVREELRAQYLPIVDDGIANFQKALDIDKEYDDAMVYMNLLIRERADLLDDPEEYKKQIEIADNWQQKSLDTRKLKASRQPTTGGITAEPAK